MPIIHRPVRPKPHAATQTPNHSASARTSHNPTDTSTPQREDLLSSRELADLGFADNATTMLGLATTAYVPHAYHHTTFTLSRVSPQRGAESDVLCSYLLRILGYAANATRFGTVLHEVGASEWTMLRSAFDMLGGELEGKVWAGFRAGEIGASAGT